MSTQPDKNIALDKALRQVHKKYGKGSVMKLGEQPVHDMHISTGSLSLDVALGIGGIPCGRMVEIYGPEGSGKTTLALHIIAQAQKDDGKALFIDAEHALDPTYAGNIGVNIEELLISQPSSGEEALEIAETFVRSGAIDLIVVDSVAALTPKAELEGEMGDSHMGLQARLMSQAMRKLAGVTKKTNTTVVFINQIREKIGVMFGNPETTPGGRALKFYSSVRIDIRRRKAIKQGSDILGNLTRAKVIKNKVAPPFKEAHFDIMFGVGISYVGEVLDLATDQDIIEKSGSWYSYENETIGQGRENTKDFLLEHPEMLQKIANQVKSKLIPGFAEKQEEEEEVS